MYTTLCFKTRRDIDTFRIHMDEYCMIHRDFVFRAPYRPF